MSDDLRARILAEVSRTPSATRREHLRLAAIVTAGAAAATAVLFFAMGGLHQGTRPVMLVTFTFGTALALAFTLTWLANGRSSSMLARPASALLVAALGAPPLLATVALASAVLWPDAASEEVPEHAHLACAAMTIAEGAVPLALLLWLRRGADPVHPAISGALLGVASGAFSTTLAYLRCPHAAAAHCVVAHVLPVVAFALAGAALGARLLGVRRWRAR